MEDERRLLRLGGGGGGGPCRDVGGGEAICGLVVVNGNLTARRYMARPNKGAGL